MLAATLMTLLLIVGVMMIILILLQRGRGGGLAGAFGGAGGQSAFGTKAGDVFTKITVVFAVIWVALAGINIIVLRNAADPYTAGTEAGAAEPTVTPAPGENPPPIETDDEANLAPGKSATTDFALPDPLAPADSKTGTSKEGASKTE